MSAAQKALLGSGEPRSPHRDTLVMKGSGVRVPASALGEHASSAVPAVWSDPRGNRAEPRPPSAPWTRLVDVPATAGPMNEDGARECTTRAEKAKHRPAFWTRILARGAKQRPVFLGYGPGISPPEPAKSPRANTAFPLSALSERYTTWPILPCCGHVMEPDGRPSDPVSAAALVIRVIDDIDKSDDEERDHLLSDLLCAAWGCIWARSQ